MRLRTRTFGAACAVVLLGFFGIPACGNDDSDTTTGQDEEAVETTTTVPATTAVTTGLLRDVASADEAVVDQTGQLISGEFESYYEVQVTMDDGSTRWVRAEPDVVNQIWPDPGATLPALRTPSCPQGLQCTLDVTTAGPEIPYGDQVEVVVQEVDGEERVTGPAA